MSKKQVVAVKLEPEIRQRLQALAEARRRTPHWLMCEAICLYVEREEEVERARIEPRERLARYDATGEYIGGEDVVAWLKTWGTAREKPAPTRIRRNRR
jgi:predicted transcriptional regulator